MTISFDGIAEKLKRSNENILNLKAEVASFFQEGKYPILPEDDDKILLEAIEYHKQLVIPPRFSVLAGEVIHHLRSCLDHVVWQFSSPQYRKDGWRKIEFPVFDKRPVDKQSVSLYQGKTKGVTNTNVLSLIESRQPYNAPDPIDSPIHIIHDMDRIDKHRELVLHFPIGTREFPIAVGTLIDRYQREHPDAAPTELAMEFKSYGNLVPQISCSEKIQPLLVSLSASAIARHISVSRWYAGRIREGYRPHPRHWKALAELVGVSPTPPTP